MTSKHIAVYANTCAIGSYKALSNPTEADGIKPIDPEITEASSVKISPNKKAWISILILLKEITIIPIERARWAKTPKSVSVDKILFCCNHKKSIPKSKHTIIIPKLIPVPSKIPNPTPNNELCAIDSP